MQSNQNAVIQILDSPSDDQKIEVSLESTEDGQRVVLRYSTWTDGLGWCSQKTIRVDADHLDNLHRALTVARHRINRDRAQTGHLPESAKVIHLPTLS